MDGGGVLNHVNNNLSPGRGSTEGGEKIEVLARFVDVNTKSFPHWSLIYGEEETEQERENRYDVRKGKQNVAEWEKKRSKVSFSLPGKVGRVT